MNYRKDRRSVEQFAKDIKESSLIERELMTLYVNWLNAKAGGSQYTFEDFGCDNSGELIKEEGKVNTKADFLLRKNGIRPRRIEIKYCKRDLPVFHLKISQLVSYTKNDVCIVNWMGIDTPNRRFCIITPTQIQDLLDNGKRFNFWQKPCIQIKTEDCTWNML